MRPGLFLGRMHYIYKYEYYFRGFMIAFAKILILVTAGLSWQNAEASETFVCQFVPLTKASWIPPQFAVQIFDDRKSARIWDAPEGSSVPVVLERRSESTFLLDWTVTPAALAKFPGMASERYQVMLNMRNLKVSLRVLSRLEHDGLSPRGAGTCVLVQKERASSQQNWGTTLPQ